MSARELVEPYPYVTLDEHAACALRLLSLHGLPALLVVDADARPYAVVPCARLVGQFTAAYATPTAAADGRTLDGGQGGVAGLTVAQWLPPDVLSAPTVEPEASVTEIAAVIARTNSPLVAVVERDGDQEWLAGAVTAARVIGQLAEGS
ncbi:hypothetical protein [Streptomyces cadmiisoli]|uniref:hypothetical protein n=1 Tax=Streptomyces cadmiisoli TaxID=2184053 RepID=UPI003D75D0F5